MATTEATLLRTNERPGTRAKLSGLRTSAFKVREVLNLIRGEDVARANEILTFCERGPAEPIQKLLNSAIANAEHNDGLAAEELFVSACFADEGPTMKRIRFKGHGRVSRRLKRSSSITIIVSRLPEERLAQLRAAQEKAAPARGRRRTATSSRSARVAKSQAAAPAAEEVTEVEEVETPAVETPEVEETTTAVAEAPETTETEKEEK